MNFTPLLALLPLTIVMSVTPGPNNIMVMSSGVNFGMQRTWPHMMGVAIGFPLLLAAVGLGLGQVFKAYPLIQTLLKILGILYLLWMAWGLSQARALHEPDARKHPLSFFEAALFQWINPKAWLFCIALMAEFGAYVVARWLNLAMICVVVGAISLLSVLIWGVAGTLIAQKLHSPIALRRFNWTMAVALVLSLIPMIH
ncbi:MAG: LysE family translocator [Alphaproteobacteria bacterium]|nr:LysE family translocator [Alphaproteobacteria bacterium]